MIQQPIEQTTHVIRIPECPIPVHRSETFVWVNGSWKSATDTFDCKDGERVVTLFPDVSELNVTVKGCVDCPVRLRSQEREV